MDWNKIKDVFYDYKEHRIRRIIQDSDKKSFMNLEQKLNTGIETENRLTAEKTEIDNGTTPES